MIICVSAITAFFSAETGQHKTNSVGPFFLFKMENFPFSAKTATVLFNLPLLPLCSKAIVKHCNWHFSHHFLVILVFSAAHTRFIHPLSL